MKDAIHGTNGGGLSSGGPRRAVTLIEERGKELVFTLH
jgi:hypothetical protein